METMVEIHNFLNEQAWGEVMRWEKGQRGLVIFCLSRIGDVVGFGG